MARGKYWEMSYEPDADAPQAAAHLDGMEGTAGWIDRRIVSKSDEPVSVQWKRKDPARRHFQRCDFALSVVSSQIANCKFTNCRFAGSSWQDVRFGNCTFEFCDFSGCTFSKCTFLDDCVFSKISASAELFRIDDTAISASGFISNLQTNVAHLPKGVTKQYQLFRFTRTRSKIAKAVFDATRNEADVGYYFEAYEQLTRCDLDERVERHRYDGDSTTPNNRWVFALRSSPARIERSVILTSGALTSWGRSVMPATVYLALLVVIFTIVYGAILKRSWPDAVIEALNVTLVAGYDAYYEVSAPLFHRILWLVNMSLGLFWYALVVPVVSRRVLR